MLEIRHLLRGPIRRFGRGGVALAFAFALSSCGGGGGGSADSTGSGGGSGTGTGGTGTTASTGTGLIPAAPITGAVLVTDATQLRVLRPGATWNYRGVEQLGGMGNTGVYSDVVMHAAAAGGTAETASNSSNQGASTAASVIIAAGGVVKTIDTIDFTGLGKPQTFDDVELRSPVRQDDQYVIFDQHFEDGGTDFDGDGKHDALDFASWRRVVGTEVLDLHNRRQVTTVRVDQTVRVRARYSSNGSYSDVLEETQSTWYAPGIGIVRVRTDQLNPNTPTLRRIDTEDLLTWDGLTEGVGPLPAQAASIQPGTASVSAGYPNLLDGAAFDDHAVVLSTITGAAPAQGMTVTALDPRGRLMATRNYEAASLGATYLSGQRLVRLGSVLGLIAFAGDRLALLPLDASGQVAASGLVTLTNERQAGLGSGRFAEAAAGSDRFWLVWQTVYQDASLAALSDLKVQAFDAAGRALTPAVALEQGVSTAAISNVRITTSADDPVLVSWSFAGGVSEVRYAVLDPSSGALLARRVPAQTGYAFSGVVLEPAALDRGLTLNAALDPSTGVFTGVLLDPTYGPIRSSASASFTSEVVAPAWLQPVQGYAASPVGRFGRLFEVVYSRGREFPEDASISSIPTLVEITPAATLAAGDVRLLGRLPPLSTVGGGLQIPMRDRNLLVIAGTNSIIAIPVWRAP